MAKNKNREFIESFFPNTLLCDGHDNAIIGISESFGKPATVLYNKDIIIKNFMDSGMTEEEAMEYFSYNVLGSYVGEYTPTYATIIEHEKEKD